MSRRENSSRRFESSWRFHLQGKTVQDDQCRELQIRSRGVTSPKNLNVFNTILGTLNTARLDQKTQEHALTHLSSHI
jgi:hypothetical protein